MRAEVPQYGEGYCRCTSGPGSGVTLKELLDQWKDSQQWKPRTVANRKQSIDRILDHFDGSRSVRSIRPGEIDDWIGWMARPKEGKKKGRGLAKSTWSKHLKDARQAFRYGVRKGYLDKDPTDHRKAPVQENKERERFITREVTTKVLEACTTRDWQRIIALARYGGLRCPSEVMRLCWSDINYEEGWFLIRSPKTEHHPGRDVRKCPIFPELWPYLVRCENEGGKRVVVSGGGRSAGTEVQQDRRAGRAEGLAEAVPEYAG